MKIFKKHYEKFIFIFLLLVSLILFGLQVDSVANPSEESLLRTYPEPVADYQKIDFQDDKYSAEKTFQNKSGIVLKKYSVPASEKGTVEKKVYEGIDLMVPPVLAKCPNNRHLIPVTDFPSKKSELKQKKCSYCASPLEYIPPEQIAKINPEISTKDTDGDGIPDADEVRLGLNPNNRNDANSDFDDDGFTNLEEYRSKTDIRNPKSRDSYTKKIYVKNIEEEQIGIRVVRITGITKKNEDDPSKWFVQFASETKVKRGKKEIIAKKTSKQRMGKELKRAGYTGDDYLVEKIVPKFDDKQGERQNVSTIYLKRTSDNIEFVARVGEDFIDPRKKVTFELELPPTIDSRKEFQVTIGEEFKLGNDKTRVDKLKVTSAIINREAKEAEKRMTARVVDVERNTHETVGTRQTNLPMEVMPEVEVPNTRQSTIKRF